MKHYFNFGHYILFIISNVANHMQNDIKNADSGS